MSCQVALYGTCKKWPAPLPFPSRGGSVSFPFSLHSRGGEQGSIPWAGDKPGVEGLETLVRPWVLIRSARDSAGCSRLVRLGAFLTSSQTREVVRREEGGRAILELKL